MAKFLKKPKFSTHLDPQNDPLSVNSSKFSKIQTLDEFTDNSLLAAVQTSSKRAPTASKVGSTGIWDQISIRGVGQVIQNTTLTLQNRYLLRVCARDLSKPWTHILRIWFLYRMGLDIGMIENLACFTLLSGDNMIQIMIPWDSL